MDDPTAYYENIFKDNPSHLDLTDGVLFTEDGCSFRIHKSALTKCSKYFLALFCGIGKGRREYVIPGITGEVLSNILSYMYTKEICVTEKNICDIIVASDYLLLDNLLSQIQKVFEKNLSVANCFAIHLSLLNVNRKDLLRESYRFIETHFEELVCGTDEGFYKLPAEVLKQLFDDRNLRVQNEKVVWKAIVQWVEADLSNRLPEVGDLLTYLRINDVDENLAAEILTHAIVAKNKFCETIHFKGQTSYRCVLKLHQCHVWNDAHSFPFYISRKPQCLNFIFLYPPWGVSGKTQIYVTYDEKIDMWRKIIEVKFRPHYLVCLCDCMYLFRTTAAKIYLRYNLIEKKWVDFKDIRIQRLGYVIVTLGGFLYILGGRSLKSEDVWPKEVYDVEVYDPEENAWHDATPILPIVKYTFAVTLSGRIYVVGKNNTGTGLSAQVYDPSTGIWNEIPQPSSSSNFVCSLVAYNEKICIIGGSYVDNTLRVEVFDPLLNVWNTVQNLPYNYMVPKALVVNDRLFVFDYYCSNERTFKVNPPVQWNKDQDGWETIAEYSPMFNLRHYFFTVQDGDGIDVVSKQNKMPTSVFEKSLFS